MDFWARQREARRRSRWLVVLFIAAVAAIVVAVNLVVLTFIAAFGEGGPALAAGSWAAQHPGAVWVTSLAVLAFIGSASLYKTMSLAGGGGVVARALGGQRVQADTTDPAEQRLVNVVEELAIASGVPVPAVYVLHEEDGINAFAAGYSPATAAVAVTRGALDQLDRAELQGVIGHEFSHILNGDMRLNMRLIGLLHGLLVLAVAGRTILRGVGGGRRSRSGDGRGVAFVFLAAMALMVLGYIGVFFGRLIQAAVSRQREFLADASSVQFNRDVTGLRNALLKIGQVATSRLRHPEAESAAHMLFAPGITQWFATHPPLAERIRAIDPTFETGSAIRREVGPQPLAVLRVVRDEAVPRSFNEPASLASQFLRIEPSEVSGRVANFGGREIAEARRLRAALEAEWSNTPRQTIRAAGALFALTLDPDQETRERELTVIRRQLGDAIAQEAGSLAPAVLRLPPGQRLPLLGRLVPALQLLPSNARTALLECIDALCDIDGERAIFEFALGLLARTYLAEETNPAARVRPVKLRAAVAEARALLTILATHGHADAAVRSSAFREGMIRLGLKASTPIEPVAAWTATFLRSLRCLDGLPPEEKRRLIEAVTSTIRHDGVVTVSEAELLRVVCALLHCPLPPLVSTGNG
ncbi:MAG: M48 family metallopeptidase [Gammaproteobacteria bacterium]|nr:M48 family metallopeptidase [Gammaproteobacteria bacterium]